MTLITARIIAPLTAALAASLGSLGCKHEQPASTTRPIDVRKEAYWQETPLRVAQDPVCVVQGPTPLVHIFDIGGPIRVVDLTAQRPLIAMEVRDRTLVRVDDRNGVTFGSDNVVPGPLVAGHLYGIYADPTTDNIMRHGIGPPGNSLGTSSGNSPSR
jgi:hypothetical protein